MQQLPKSARSVATGTELTQAVAEESDDDDSLDDLEQMICCSVRFWLVM